MIKQINKLLHSVYKEVIAKAVASFFLRQNEKKIMLFCIFFSAIVSKIGFDLMLKNTLQSDFLLLSC